MSSQKQILLTLASLALATFTVVSLYKQSANKSAHADLYSKIEYYNAQTTEKGSRLALKDGEFDVPSLLELQKVLDEKAPYLDTFTNFIRRSYLMLRPEDSHQGSDTLRFIAWHKAYLENLAYQKRAQQLVDSIAALYTMKFDSSASENRISQLERGIALLKENDSAIRATSIIETNLHKQVGKMQMPE